METKMTLSNYGMTRKLQVSKDFSCYFLISSPVSSSSFLLTDPYLHHNQVPYSLYYNYTSC